MLALLGSLSLKHLKTTAAGKIAQWVKAGAVKPEFSSPDTHGWVQSTMGGAISWAGGPGLYKS